MTDPMTRRDVQLEVNRIHSALVEAIPIGSRIGSIIIALNKLSEHMSWLLYEEEDDDDPSE